ncbi:S1 family peptidase [Streptomyces hainanensis]|uniref:S1 family peptidase n=1 Tax=Streptomyces hainanensis TaxID=402648 RepID=UPI001405425C|nr:serine protease [Streptomyces hainanensis]
MLLSTDTVLTCAHVVGAADRPVLVDLVGAPGSESVPARVDTAGWVPESGDQLSGLGGDLALLRLDRPQPPGRATMLRRLSPTWDRPVRMYGFPEGLDQGIYLRGRLAGGIGGDGRVQIFPEEAAEVVRPGFSGAGVTDQQTGQVIGIVVNAYLGQGLRLSFMIPTETVIRHLPGVRQRTEGDSVVDRELVSTSTEPAEEPAFAAWLAGWLRGGDDAPAVDAALVEPADRARNLTLRRALTQADRELSTTTGRAPVTPGGNPDTVPPVGSLDLAIDVGRQTPTELAERICRRMGVEGAPDRPAVERLATVALPLTIVVHGVDRAPEPARLDELLGLLGEQGSRLLLVFHTAPAETRDTAVAALRLRHRIGRLSRGLDTTAELKRRFRDRRRQVSTTDLDRATGALTTISFLRRSLSRLRREASAADRTAARLHAAHDELDDYERLPRSAASRLEAALTRLDALVVRRNELRGRLGAAQARARAANGEEDLQLARLYAAAHDLLWRAPCDVAAAETAVLRYLAAVTDRGDEPPAGVVTR